MSGRPAVTKDRIVVSEFDYHDHARDRVVALTPQGRLAWQAALDDEPTTDIITGPDGTIYVGTLYGHFYAISPRGRIKWRFHKTSGHLSGSPALSGKTIYFSSEDHYFYALRTTNGRMKWRFKTGGRVFGSPAIDPDGTIYFGSGDGYFYAVRDGRRRAVLKWKYNHGGACSDCVLAKNRIYFVSNTSDLYCLTKTGRLRWRLAAGKERSFSDPVADPSGRVFVGGLGGITAVSPKGRLLWRLKQSGDCSRPIIGPRRTLYSVVQVWDTTRPTDQLLSSKLIVIEE